MFWLGFGRDGCVRIIFEEYYFDAASFLVFDNTREEETDGSGKYLC